MAFTYQTNAFTHQIHPLAESVNTAAIIQYNTANMNSLNKAFNIIKNTWDNIDFVIHAIAHSNKIKLKSHYMNTSQKNFLQTINISCFSFTAITQHTTTIISKSKSLLTLTYHNANTIMPNYNIIDIAKATLEASVRYLASNLGPDKMQINAISTGPMQTLAKSTVGSARQIYNYNHKISPLQQNIILNNINRAGLYLLSNLSKAITSKIHYINCDFNMIGMQDPASKNNTNSENNT